MWHSAGATVRKHSSSLVACLVVVALALGVTVGGGFFQSRAALGAKPAVPSRPRPSVQTWQLQNGLRVLFVANHTAPVATVQIFYHVGSKDEHVGNRGVAHMFEHLMFKGSTHVAPEEHARLLKEVGGVANAFTTEDVTAYHQTVPPSYADFAIRLEAERMRGLRLFPTTVDSERKVVEEEKRLRIDNSPIGQAIERFRALAYTRHPYQWTAAGVIADLEKVTPADCQAFYDKYYRPENATLIVVGDLDEASVRQSVDKYFGPLERGPAAGARTYPDEPPQTEPRDATLLLPVALPVLVGGYHIPGAADADVPALQVLAMVLSAGESSRMHRRLVRRDQLAVAAGGFAEVMEQSGLFLVYAMHLPDRDQAQIRRALLDEIAKVRTQPIAAADLAKAKNQLTAGYVFGLGSVDGVARELGLAQLVEGDWHRFLDASERYEKVTAADVMRVARKYLVDAGLTMVTLKPQPMAMPGAPAAPPRPAAAGDGAPSGAGGSGAAARPTTGGAP